MKNKLNKLGKLFWFLKNRNEGFDLDKDKNMIIHQTLALGSMDDVRRILHIYGRDVVAEEFQKPAKGLYHPAILEFFEYFFKTKVDKSQYIKDIHGRFTS
ncbi:MAG TPA: hypothetical protein DIC35_04025 [Candidatus Moranbacteria bacterium]|nr:hypothetical protein [Candidatus Moranbacteria bacterium]